MSEATKRCPQCGEEILAVAKKCKHCGSMLDLASPPQGAIARPLTNYGLALLAIPLVAILLLWFWVAQMSLLQSPGDTLVIIVLVTVIGTAVVAAVEAGNAGMTSDRTKGTYSPTAWFFLITLLWFIGYPAYLLKRKAYGLGNLFFGGTLLMLAFVGSAALLDHAIETKKAEILGNIEASQKQLESFIKSSTPVAPKEQVVVPPAKKDNVQQFMENCREGKKENGMKFGGMEAKDAEALAVTTCNEEVKAFTECIQKDSTAFDKCFAEASTTAE